MKKILSIILSMGLLLTSSSVFASNYPDVDETASYASAVDTLTALEIVEGDDNGLFNPDNKVTRAEFAKMVVEALGAGNEVDHNTTTNFVDSTNHWAKGYIQTGVAKEFINGYDDITFGPDDNVTYAQAVKMLVAAIGYETYASQQGGWPSGYLAYGNELGIMANIENNTALTRAQCADLVVKALKAPICKVNGYEQNYQGEWVPKYEEMNGLGTNWQTLLTTKHDAYTVKGRVMSVNKKEGTVDFRVEAAENFNGANITASNATTETVNGYSDSLFVYSEAIIQKDKDTNEYTMISLTPYGTVKTVEFAAIDVDTDKTTATAIEVKKDNTNKTTSYKVSSELQIFKNGASVPSIDYTDKRAMVTLVDSSAIGSTSTDGIYDYAIVDSYDVAKVTNVRVKDDEVTVVTDDNKKIKWSLVEEDTTRVTIVKNNEIVDYTAINEDDIINYAYEGSLDTTDWVDIIVSDETITGLVTGKIDSKNYIVLDGENYEVDYDECNATINLNTEYTLYLDAFGYVCDAEEIDSDISTGIVATVFTRTGEDVPVVRVIESNGKIATYEMKSAAAALEMTQDILKDYDITDSELAKPTTADDVKARAVDYVISNDKFVFKGLAKLSNTDSAVEFKASTSKLGAYTIANETVVIDLDAYLNNNGEPAAFNVANFENEGDYNAWIYNRDTKTGINEFVILVNGSTSLKPSSAMSVVVASGSVVDIDGVTCQKLIVNENTEVLYAGLDTVPEGSIIMYTIGNDGYVETDKLHVIYTPTDTYETLMTNVFTPFTAGKVVADADGYTIDLGNGTDDKVEVFFGPVYSASNTVLELFVSATGNINETEAFTIGNANVYTYNYDAIANEGLRVTPECANQKNTIYKNMFADADKTIIDWSTRADAMVDPVIAFVRVIDNDVTDVIYFIAE